MAAGGKSGEMIAAIREATRGLLGPIQRAAEARGHGPHTAAAGWGGLIGGILGSFLGPWGAAVGAAAGAGIAYRIGDRV
jgi:hypothetical protein